MSNIGSNNSNQIQNNYFIWLLVYLGIGFAISFILPFPISLVVLLLVFFLLNIIRTEITLRKYGIGGIRGLYKSLSSFGSSNGGFGGFGGFGYNPIKFYCMNCGHEHREVVCPNCGSKMVRAR
jgi:hypothetical protein